MKLTLTGHDDRYAVEQLLMSLFSAQADITAQSRLHRGKVWLTAVTVIACSGRTVTASKRLKACEETVRLRRRILQQMGLKEYHWLPKMRIIHKLNAPCSRQKYASLC